MVRRNPDKTGLQATQNRSKAYVTRLLGARETIHRLKDEERGAKRLRPAAWGPAAPAAFGTRTAATTSWLPPAPPAPYVVAASAAAPRLV